MNQVLDLCLTPNLILSVSGRRSGSPAYVEHSADQLGLWIDRFRPDAVMSGMALGLDTLAAEITMDRGRNLYAVIPGEWQPNRWNQDQRLHWRELISYANGRLEVIDKRELVGGAKSRGQVLDAFHARNAWMVAHSTVMAVCWDGIASGGTYHALNQCVIQEHPTLLIQPGQNTRLCCDKAALQRAIRAQTHSVGVPDSEIIGDMEAVA